MKKIKINRMPNIPKFKTEGEGKGKKLSIILIIIAVLISVGTMLSGFITDWMWFREMGYSSVFFKELFTKLKFGIPLFIAITIFMEIYLRKLRKGYFTKIVSHESTDMKKLNITTNIMSIIFGGIAAAYFADGLWFELLKFIYSTDFKIKDPLFGHDISFYIFKFEFLKKLNDMFIGILLFFIFLTVIYYLVLITVRTPDEYDEDEAVPFEGQDNNADGSHTSSFKSNRGYGRRGRFSENNLHQLFNIASGQISALAAVLFIMLGVHFFLRQFRLLHAHTGVVYGAGFTDVNITLWIYRIMMVLSVVGAVSFAIHIKKREYKKLLRVPATMVVVGIAGVIISTLVQNFVVSTDEINKEAEYLKKNIEYTQYAYDVQDVHIKPFKADKSLTPEDIKRNNETISNIRINDYQPVRTFYNQTQSIRRYYKFNDVDVDRYTIGGKNTQTYTSLREIDEEKINDTWLNRHLKYTHGYGLALSRVDQITPSGQPDVLVKNIPPESSVKDIKITRPEVYFGELSNDYIVVNTSEEEFDYPDGNKNKYSRYKGEAGIKLTPFNRLMFSIREGSMKLLVSSNITGKSRIIVNRNINDRIEKIMPHLEYEDDPYAVIADGKLYWMVDAYTRSSYYPYSEPYNPKEGTNYIRNSVKIVVDAYNGDVDYYIVDKKDPIARTCAKIYPELFKDVEEMPESLREHIRYPNALFKIQADVYGRYHMKDVKVFYQDEDNWDIAHQMYGTEEEEMKPNYYIAKLPGEKTTEFVSVLPFTPKSKQNMTALMMAGNDGKNYGKLVVYQFPKNKTVYGPMQIEAQIDQSTQISSDFSLWSQAGSKYSRGNLFVVPVENSLLYVEPIYLEASNSAIPEVKRVIVAYGDKIAYKPTLAAALEELFGEDVGVKSVVPGAQSGGSTDSGKVDKDTPEKPENIVVGNDEYIAEAQKAYDAGQEALKKGDWAEYGKCMDQLKENLDKLADNK